MSIFAGARKCDLKILAEELGETVNDSHNLKDLKKIILASKEYDEESAKEWMNMIINERTEREENEIRQEAMAERKRKDEQEIAERKRKEEQEIAERKRKEEQEIAERRHQEEIAERRRQKEIELRKQEYEERKRKDEIEFELQKNTPWSRRSFFNEWANGVKADSFGKLSDLIITDQIKRKVSQEIKDHFIDEWSKLNSPDDLFEKLADYDTLRSTFRSKQPRKEWHYDKQNSFKDDSAFTTNEKKRL
ncbi:hypothetical protein AVEN_130144-1 [Araneus ventricosus]|uniref:Uncharacterized protein n=1 Tax=Araneus ventricosus TaxID=182803 RepID=A0A4Y2MZZ3_ARAVE|nr:hypothetical protein AVEN_130144-1 [Araneus ventricosus]